MTAENLIDLSKPIDVPLLDATIAAFYGTRSKEEVTPSTTAPPLFVRLEPSLVLLCKCTFVGSWIRVRPLVLQRTAADHILRELQNNPNMWLQVVHNLQSSQSLNTKFFALQ